MGRNLFAINLFALCLFSCKENQEKIYMNDRENEINLLFEKRGDILNPGTAYKDLITSSLLSTEMKDDVFSKALQVLYEIDYSLFFLIEKSYNANLLFDLKSWQDFESCIEPKCSIDQALSLLSMVIKLNQANPEILVSKLVELLNCTSLEDYNNKLINTNMHNNI